ncbi:uncharacterized protein LOC110280405 [Arachis duranensis]|uniref:Uncharacterized protein LOC110280405 n=1 Tax=Arachis duranensis TaxID=130453 RepID=A0A6P5NKA3_ARADU|nr:uncharacterized protein LOC110280405 [Arachis duranensis]XP_025692363.1 uncharacterized protein LOC112794587 [Arachis hypogaea]
MWRQVISRFGILEFVISDNGTQFMDKKFREFLTGMGIKQRFSSVEHPQTNDQVKAANKVILQGYRKGSGRRINGNAHLSETALKQRIALRYNARVLRRSFELNDLVLRRNNVGLPTLGEGKLATNWKDHIE